MLFCILIKYFIYYFIAFLWLVSNYLATAVSQHHSEG